MSSREVEVSDKDVKCMEDLQTWQNDLNRLGEGGFRDRSYAYESESRLHKYCATSIFICTKVYTAQVHDTNAVSRAVNTVGTGAYAY